MRVAICYWGLTRSTKQVYESHIDNIFNVFRKSNIDYEIFMHTWKLAGKQRIGITEINKAIDYEEYKLLKPNHYEIDNQDDFTQSLNFSDYFHKSIWDKLGDNPKGEWPPNLILNHLCALESLKRVTNMVIKEVNTRKKEFQVVIYLRPDARIIKAFPVHKLGYLKNKEILISNFDHFEGLNDRFAAIAYKSAPIYGMRIDEIKEYRKTQGRIVSEKYVKYICSKYKLKVIFIKFRFQLVRP